jgi:hypothetical protein
MYSDPNLQSLKELFADRLSRDSDVRSAINDLSADLPTADLKQDMSDLARWLLAVYKTTRTPATAGNNARDKALHGEDGRLRMLLRQGRFNQNALLDLHNRLAEAVANADRLNNPQQLKLIREYLNAQTKRRVASPPGQPMSEAS